MHLGDPRLPGIRWSRDQLVDSSTGERKRHVRTWTPFSPARPRPFNASEVANVLEVLQADADDRRPALLRTGLTPEDFKDLLYSINLAATIWEALEFRKRNRAVSLPREAPEDLEEEVAQLQSAEHIYSTVATELSLSSDTIRSMIGTFETLSKAQRSELADTQRSRALDPYSFDSKIGRKIGFPLMEAKQSIDRPFVPSACVQTDSKVDSLLSANGVTLSPELLDLLEGSQLFPGHPCECKVAEYTWTENFNRSWTATWSFDVPCGTDWCKKTVWGVPFWYPCDIKYCTVDIDFGFSAEFSVGFQATIDCTGVIITASGATCASASVAGLTLTSCIEVFATAGGGLDVDIEVGTQAGECLYGGELTLGVRATVADYTVYQASIGYDYAFEAECLGIFNPLCQPAIQAEGPIAASNSVTLSDLPSVLSAARESTDG